MILDCAFPAIEDAAALHARLKGLVGVVETGFFIGMADTVVAATAAGLKTLERR